MFPELVFTLRIGTTFEIVLCYETLVPWKLIFPSPKSLINYLFPSASRIYLRVIVLLELKSVTYGLILNMNLINMSSPWIPLPLEEIIMKKDIDVLCEGLNYVKGFGPSEVRPFMHRKWYIDTHAILQAVNNLNIEDIFGEDRDLIPYHSSFVYMACF